MYLTLKLDLTNLIYIYISYIFLNTGGAIGYIAYDCVKHFEPRTARELNDPFGLPDSFFLLCDTLVIFDHVYQLLNVVSHYRSNSTDPNVIEYQYRKTVEKIQHVLNLLQTDHIPSVPQGEIHLNQSCTSNVGKIGYEGFVTRLKKHIKNGDIIQAVPSQRLARPTNLHPFNVYRHLRTLNPSPYMFYLDFKDYQIVGASPELLVKVENDMVYTHPIAGTRKRGKTQEGIYYSLVDFNNIILMYACDYFRG